MISAAFIFKGPVELAGDGVGKAVPREVFGRHARDGSHDDAGVGRFEAGGRGGEAELPRITSSRKSADSSPLTQTLGGGFSVSTLPAVAGGGGSVHHLAAGSAPATGRTAAGCGRGESRRPPFRPTAHDAASLPVAVGQPRDPRAGPASRRRTRAARPDRSRLRRQRCRARSGPTAFSPPSGPARRLFQEHPAKSKFLAVIWFMTGKGAWNEGSNIAAVQVGWCRPVRQTSRRRRNRAPATSRPTSALLGSGTADTADQVSEFPLRAKDPAPVGATVFPL